MLVQNRSAHDPRLSNNHRRSTVSAVATTGDVGKGLDGLASWTSENLSKIVIAGLFIASAAAVIILLPGIGDTAAFLCFERSESSHFDSSRIHLPSVNWNSVPRIVPAISDPFYSFRAERWIVVAAPSHSLPSATLRRLAGTKGWQLLAVATSRTPLDFTLKGAIILSLELQSRLGFRSTAFLPYDSHVRKSIGYLFAIQHGARLIYDTDDRADVLDGDIGRRFDLQLSSGNEILLQYSHHDPNRTVVNPYIHFGQHSVWPRGLPLDCVSKIDREEFYTEVYGGNQFIQQGLSDGLPDVDAVFYFTRKSSGLEAFDIRFDGDAPKVALPQGIMIPVNSFNTLFHSQAFWALMLPVSVSSMASDVLRGYWTQRILWEIGGHVAVYPPTIHRLDNAQAYPFAEEKDLHVNVGRLIDFLLSWRSNKATLFERILHLSYAMAEEGFWSEVDMRFTAAWLQDLLAVGYQQSRLMSLELDRPRAMIGHGDRKEFYPRKLPSVHLGVEEVGIVSTEIGNLIKWRKNFGNVVLVMHCSRPVDRTALEWRLLYGRVFKTVIILSEERNADLMVEEGHLSHAYKYLPKIFSRYAGADGFIFLQDNLILNYWNLPNADKNKLWITNKVSESWFTSNIDSNSSQWAINQASLLKQAVNNFPAHFQTNYRNSNGEQSLTICGSELFYIPRRFVADFVDLVELVRNLDIHHIVAVPMIFMAMDSPQNFDSDALSKTLYLKEKGGNGFNVTDYSDRVPAVYPLNVSNELEFIELVRVLAAGDQLLKELV
ncbi:probable glycosyltransferase STELLO1 [Phalaenopsis equestris]|uniref:probable glycosyltransferase STELLO1 n=1 Tax=Phalaenopsis equestris TaxID=78828 RepID=UPI0009E422FB|nr:probable glycosyltransferase STELLO1 [Phalaenopsis equestris]